MTDTPEAVRLADWLQAAVQTYPQVSADEPGGYCSEMDQMIDQAAALLRRIPAIETARDVAVELAAKYAAERDQLRAELEKVSVLYTQPAAPTPPNADQKGQ